MYVPVRSTQRDREREGESGWMDKCVAYERVKDNIRVVQKKEKVVGDKKKRKKQAAKVTQNVTLRLLTRSRTS